VSLVASDLRRDRQGGVMQVGVIPAEFRIAESARRR
jgi:hypothetical protein